MSERAEHREYEADYYSQTHSDLAKKAAPSRFGAEDRQNVRDNVDKRTGQAASNYSVDQGQQLLQDQATRGDAPAPSANYAAHDHQDLYNMVHTNMDPGELDARGRVSNKLGNWLADVSNSINTASTSSQIEWQGAGADQAHSFFQNTATYAASTANAAQLSSNRYSQQAAAASYAQNNMPEPTGFNQQAEIQKATQQIHNGDLVGGTLRMTDISAKQQQSDAAHQQAVQVMQGLDNTYHETATTQPQFSAPPVPGGADNSTQISSAQPVAGAGGHGGGFNGPAGSPGGPGGAPGGPGGGAANVGGNAYNPGASTGAGTFPGSGPGGSGGFRPPAGGGGFGRVSPDGMAFGGGPGGVGGSGQDTVRGRSGFGGGGRAGGGSAGGRVSGGGGSAKPGEGEGSGAKGASERLERGATAAANAGKGGKAGAPGAAGAAGAGKKKEDDKEHKNKLPTQVDPDEVFEVRPERGPDGEKITPPVIGG